MTEQTPSAEAREKARHIDLGTCGCIDNHTAAGHSEYVVEAVTCSKHLAIAQAIDEAAPKWMPIETAPKDGSDILTVSFGRTAIAWWSKRGACWRDGDMEGLDLSIWQPLPAPKGEK